MSVQYARMLVEAERLKVVDDVLTIAAIMETGGITIPPPSRNQPDRPDWRQMVPGEYESNVLGQLAVWQMAENMTKDDMREKGVSLRSYFRAKEIRHHLAQAVRQFFRFGSTGRREDILKSVCAGMVDHLYRGVWGRYQNGESGERELGSASLVRAAEWVVGKPFDLQIKTRRGMMTLKLIELASRVNPDWLAEVAPQLVERKNGLSPRYDAEKDIVVSTTQMFFNGQMVKEEAVADGQHLEAAKVFARWLASQMSVTDEGLNAVLRANTKRQERARQLNLKTGERTFKVYSPEEMVERFVAALSGARRMSEVLRPEALALPALDENLAASVLRDNPDVVNLLGNELAVEYEDGYGHSRPNPRVKLSDETTKANGWNCLPDEGVRLPGGRLVEVVVSFGYYNTISDTDIPQLKAKVREHLNREQWDRWSDKPEMAVPDPTVEGSEVPFVTAVYGRCVATGKELTAYGTMQASRSWSSDPITWKPVWCRDKAEAEKVRAEAAQKLEEKRELETARAEAETAREVLRGLPGRDGWDNLDRELRRQVGSWQDLFLPRTIDELRADKAETEALIAKVESALSKRNEGVDLSRFDPSKLFGGNVYV